MRNCAIHVNPRSIVSPDKISVDLRFASLEFTDAQENRVIIWARNYGSDETKIAALSNLWAMLNTAICEAIAELESAAGAEAPDAADARPAAEGTPPAVETDHKHLWQFSGPPGNLRGRETCALCGINR